MLLFEAEYFLNLQSYLISLGYLGNLLNGLFFKFGFTSSISTVVFLILGKQQNNIFLAAFLGGVGALISDLLIFKFIRISFADEIRSLSKEKINALFEIVKK